MRRRHLRTLALWLLPLLVARAFLPVGFMLSFQAGALDVTFCPSQTPTIVTMLDAQAAHAHHQHHSPEQPADGSSVEPPPCPYGTAAVAISIDVPAVVGTAPQVDDYSRVADLSFHAGIGPVRAERIRGPPFLS